jgi:hypothetical protein
LVGARLDDYQKGAAYFFERSGGSWGQSYKATADNATTGQQFGTAVALDGQTAAIYALGQLHLLERSVDGNWGQSAKLPAYAGSSGVWIDGETILAGAFTDSETFIRAGAAFVFQSETPANDAPVAIAGSDVAIRAGDNVCLDGGSSFDDNTDSGALQYAWTFSYRPSTSSAELIGADTATPCFTADVADTFSLQLVVSDGQGLSSVPDFLEVGANNLPPTAVAGLDQLVVTGTVVALNGSNSTDPENESLTYSWTLDVAPPGSAAVLSGAETATASFTADQEGAYEIALSVSDALGPGESDFLTVVAASPTEFASIQIIEINEIVVVLPPDAFPSPGLQNPIINLLMQAERALQRGDIATAIEKLQSALNRTDGCVLRGEPDADGEGRDWITDCTAQEQIYFLLETTLDALTP